MTWNDMKQIQGKIVQIVVACEDDRISIRPTGLLQRGIGV